MRRAALQQAVGEAARGEAGVQHPQARHRDAEALQKRKSSKLGWVY